MSDKFFSRHFTASNKSLPNVSLFPTCFFGESAETYFTTRDYSEIDATLNVLLEDYNNMIMIEKPDFYRYPRCRLFNPKPTSSGICHTFNPMKLKTILKESEWVDNFLSSFTGFQENDVLKSSGVNMEKGFVFSLDTMQSYMLSLKDHIDSERNINSFLIKVHLAGEIPWMSKDQETFVRISAFDEDMSTRFITITGEIITSDVGLKYLLGIIRHLNNIDVNHMTHVKTCGSVCQTSHAQKI